MKFGYARVSGTSQDLSLQIDQLKAQGVPENNIYFEKYTGTKKDRPEWSKLEKQLRAGDEVVFTKVDRIGRTVKVAIEIVDELIKKGVKVYIIQLNGYVNTSDMMGKLMYNFLAVMAEFEHDMIVNRLNEGKEKAKKSNPNYHEGRPKRVLNGRNLAIYEYSKTHSKRETAEAMGVSESTVARIKRQAKKELSEN